MNDPDHGWNIGVHHCLGMLFDEEDAARGELDAEDTDAEARCDARGFGDREWRHS